MPNPENTDFSALRQFITPERWQLGCTRSLNAMLWRAITTQRSTRATPFRFSLSQRCEVTLSSMKC
jgi:hypothetical protein